MISPDATGKKVWEMKVKQKSDKLLKKKKKAVATYALTKDTELLNWGWFEIRRKRTNFKFRKAPSGCAALAAGLHTDFLSSQSRCFTIDALLCVISVCQNGLLWTRVESQQLSNNSQRRIWLVSLTLLILIEPLLAGG